VSGPESDADRLASLRALPDLAERLLTIADLRMHLSDFIIEDRGLLTGIRALATGRKTPAEVSKDLEEYM